MNNFKEALFKKIKKAQLNDFGVENFDQHRFGSYPYKVKQGKPKSRLFNKKEVKREIKKLLLYNPDFKPQLVDEYISDGLVSIDRVYQNLSKEDKELYLCLMAFRILGYKKVKLPRNNNDYWEAIEKASTLVINGDEINPGFLHFILKKMDLKPIGYDIKMFFTEKGVAVDFLIEQYAYKKKKKSIVSAEKGDYVLDLGGCWGDTALYFAHKIGDMGKVFSFEFIPGNQELFKKNISLNPNLNKRIELVDRPVTDNTGETIYYKDNGPGSNVSFGPFEEQTGTAKTISIDDFIESKGIKKVDLIKMDIEGAEMSALKGAEKTIRRFSPKLAIAIYHSKDDFVNIPNWILDLDLNYEIFLDHFSIHAEETICFAKPKFTVQ